MLMKKNVRKSALILASFFALSLSSYAYANINTLTGNSNLSKTASTPMLMRSSHDNPITITVNTTDEHLSYTAITIKNTSVTDDFTIIVLTPKLGANLLSGKVFVCPNTSSACVYKSTCRIGMRLAAGSSCNIWLKAVKNVEIPVGATSSPVKIQVTGNMQKQPGITKTVVFDLEYANNLYAGGTFTQTKNSKGVVMHLSNIAKWDGQSFQPLASGVETIDSKASVNALVEYKGDLIAGGNFIDANHNETLVTVNNIAKWNGHQWSALTDNGLTGAPAGTVPVLALAVYKGNLYAGGNFTWSKWYVGHIAVWRGRPYWHNLGRSIYGTNNTVSALSVCGGKLYIGGKFTKAGNLPSANRIASWTGSEWGTLTNYNIYDITSMTTLNGTLYAAGKATWYFMPFQVSSVPRGVVDEWSHCSDNGTPLHELFSPWSYHLITGHHTTGNARALTSSESTVYVAGDGIAFKHDSFLEQMGLYTLPKYTWLIKVFGHTDPDHATSSTLALATTSSSASNLGDIIYYGGHFSTNISSIGEYIYEKSSGKIREIVMGAGLTDINGGGTVRALLIAPSLVIEPL